MSIRKLRTFIAVAESGSFADAADTVNLTAAAVGQQIKGLEQDLGLKLFDRHKRSPRLNPSGLALLPRARELVAAYDDLPSSLSENYLTSKELRFGAVDTTMTGLVPKLLVDLRAELTGLRVRVFPGLSDDLYTQVDRGTLDVAIISEPDRNDQHLEWRSFAAESLEVIAPPDAESSNPIALLESYPYIRFNRRAWVGQQIDQWLRHKNVKIRERMELETLESISVMVSHNLGVSIVPRRCVPSPHQSALTRVPLDSSARPRLLGLVFRTDSGMQKLVDILSGLLVNIVDAAGEATVIVHDKHQLSTK